MRGPSRPFADVLAPAPPTRRTSQASLVALATVLTIVLAVSACGRSSDEGVPSTPPANTLTEKAQQAYLFTYGLVMNYRTMYMQAIDGDHEFGKWLHLGLASPADPISSLRTTTPRIPTRGWICVPSRGS